MSSLYRGFVVPMPTLPPDMMRMYSVPLSVKILAAFPGVVFDTSKPVQVSEVTAVKLLLLALIIFVVMVLSALMTSSFDPGVVVPMPMFPAADSAITESPSNVVVVHFGILQIGRAHV